MIIGSTATNVAILIINLATAALTARALGPQGRGQLALVLLYPQLIALIGMLGFDRAISVVGGQKRLTYPVLTVLISALVLSVPVIGIVQIALSTQSFSNEQLTQARWYALYTPFLYIFMFASAWFNGAGHFKQYNICRLVFYLSYLLLLLIGFMIRHLSVPVFVLSNLASVIVAACVSLLCMYSLLRKGGPNGSHNHAAVKDVSKDLCVLTTTAGVFVVPNLLAGLSGRLDQLLLSSYLDTQMLGMFVVYNTYSRLVGPLANAVSIYVFHSSIVYESKSPEPIFRTSIFSYLLGLVLLGLVSHYAIALFFGTDYLEFVNVIWLLLVAAFFYFSGQTLNEHLKGKLIGRPDTVSQLVYLVMLTIGAYLFVPTLSLLGMCIALMMAELARFSCLALAFRLFSQVQYSQFLVIRMADIADLAVGCLHKARSIKSSIHA